MIDAFLHAALMMTTPILLAAIGGLVNRIGGLVNLGLESMMLAGALVAVIVSAKTGSSALATFAALGYGRRRRPRHVARHHASFRQRGHCGPGLHRRDGGLRALLSEEHLRGFGHIQSAGRRDASAPRHPFPRLVPVLGAIVSGQDALTWLAWALVPATAFVLQQTRWGLRLRATGAAETTVRAVGLAPLSIRDASTVFAGALAGLAGAHLSIGVVGLFNEGITGGRGFIALAAFYFGRTSPFRTALGALLFGAFDAAQIRLQGHGVPAELVQTLPYVIVIIVLTGLGLSEKRGQRARTL